MKKTTNKKAVELESKKLTLEAWTRILYKEKMIDLKTMNRMIENIAKLSA